MTVAHTLSEITLRVHPFWKISVSRPPSPPSEEVVHTSSTVRVPPRPQADWHRIYAEDRE